MKSRSNSQYKIIDNNSFILLNTGIDYLIVSDLECNSGMKGFVLNEIIEFPIIIVDTKNKQVVKEFTTFVKPTYHPRLTNFIKKLTFIEQKDVDDAPILQEVFNQISEHIRSISSNGSTVCFLFDCDADAVYLRCEINLKQLTTDPCLLKYINLKDIFEKCFPVKANSLDNMIKYLDIKKQGHSHIALHDARNICQVVINMLEKGYSFEEQFIKNVII